MSVAALLGAWLVVGLAVSVPLGYVLAERQEPPEARARRSPAHPVHRAAA